jgi:hypothetical protein
MISIRRDLSAKTVYKELLDENPDAMIVIGFESAYVGRTVTHPIVAIYDYEECIRALLDDRHTFKPDAEHELMEIISECLSPESPVFVRCQ